MAVTFGDCSKGAEPAPEGGPYIAVLVRLVDIGLQDNRFDPDKPDPHQMSALFELPQVATENGFPCTLLHPIWNASQGNKKFAEFVKAISNVAHPAGVKLRDLVGKACTITVVHTESKDGSQTYANIASLRPLRAGTVVPPVKTPLFFYSLDPYYNPDLATLDTNTEKLAKFEREKVMKSVTYIDLRIHLTQMRGMKGKPASEIIDDQISDDLNGDHKPPPYEDHSGECPA